MGKQYFLFLVLLILPKKLTSQELLNGLIACFPFNKSVNDASGRGNHGGATGGFLIKDRFDRDSSAYYFNGTKDFIELNPNSFKNEFFSISLWVNMESLPAFGQSSCFISIGSSNGYQAISYYNTAETKGFVGESFIKETESIKCIASAAVNADKWYHLVFLKDINDYSLYLNGNRVSLIAAQGQKPFYGTEIPRVVIGRRSAGQNTFTQGRLDDFHIYNRPLTPFEVKILYEGQKQPEIKLKTSNGSPCMGDKVSYSVNEVTASANYLWKFNSFKKLSYFNTYEFSPEKKLNDYELEVSVEIIDDASCFPQKPIKTTAKYRIKECRELTNLTIPNIFTPNGDFSNDVWKIPELNRIPEATLHVYDRHGLLVFYSKGYEKPWDGTLNGIPLPPNTYEYIIKTNINGEKAIMGVVELMR